MDIQQNNHSNKSHTQNNSTFSSLTTPTSYSNPYNQFSNAPPYGSNYQDHHIIQAMLAMSLDQKQGESHSVQQQKHKKNSHVGKNIERTPEKNAVCKWGPGFDTPKTKKKEQNVCNGDEIMFLTPARRPTILSYELMDEIARKDRQKMKKRY